MAESFDGGASGSVDANGDLVITFGPESPNYTWSVAQVSIRMEDAPVGAVCNIFKNTNFITAVIPTGDAAGGDPPIPLWPFDKIRVVWENCTPLASGEVYYVYDKIGFGRT